jgi:hypothetical protein
VILVDDGRVSDGASDFHTLTELEEMVVASGRHYHFSVADDVIRIVPDDSASFPQGVAP